MIGNLTIGHSFTIVTLFILLLVLFIFLFYFLNLQVYFSLQPVFHNWCNKGQSMFYFVYGMVHVKYPLLLI